MVNLLKTKEQNRAVAFVLVLALLISVLVFTIARDYALAEDEDDNQFHTLANTDVHQYLTNLGILPNTILTGYALTYYDSGGNEIDDPYLSSSIHFSIGFAIPNSVKNQIQNGDYYNIGLPSEITVRNPGTAYPLSFNGTQYATATVYATYVAIVFNGDVSSMDDVTGNFTFAANLNPSEVTAPGRIMIHLPGEDSFAWVPIDVKPYPSAAVVKRGLLDRQNNPNAVTWQVDINTSQTDMAAGASITDTMPTGLTFTGNVTIYALTVDINGAVTGTTPIAMPNVNFTIDTTAPNQPKVIFNIATEQAFRVEFGTTIDNTANFAGQTKTYNNSVSLTTNPGFSTPVTTTASVKGTWRAFFSKSGAYSSNNQSITWTITYNGSSQNIPTINAIIQDAFGSYTGGNQGQSLYQILSEGSIRIQDMRLSASGSLVASGNAMTLAAYGASLTTPPSITPGGFELDFNKTIDHPVRITYTTAVNGIIDANHVLRNTATGGSISSTPQSITGTTTVTQNVMDKEMSELNYTTQQILWTMNVNTAHYQLTNPVLYDDPGPNFQVYTLPAIQTVPAPYNVTVSSMVIILDTTTPGAYVPMQEGTDYQLGVLTTPITSPHNAQFIITFSGVYANTNHSFMVIAATKPNWPNFFVNSPGAIVTNTGLLAWTDGGGHPHTSSDYAVFQQTPEQVNDGRKDGVYDATTKEITWTVYTNFRACAYGNISFTDQITTDQAFVPGSLVISTYNVDSGGGLSPGDEIYSQANGPAPPGSTQPTSPPGNYTVTTPSVSNGNTLSVYIDNSWSAYPDYPLPRIAYQFKTSLEGKYITNLYNNEANFTTDGLNEPAHATNVDITGQAIVNHGGELSEKDGSQDSQGYAIWHVNVNRSQSTLTNAEITDTLSANQKLDLSSVIIYNTITDQNGDNVPDLTRPLQEGVDYTLTYLQNPQGTYVLTIKFTHQINQSYILDYKAAIYMTTEGEAVSNSAVVSGDNVLSYSDSDTKQFAVYSNGGSGAIRGVRSSVSIRKYAADGSLLSGAGFSLTDTKGNEIIAQTNADGIAWFGGIIRSDAANNFGYSLREISPLPGYVVPDELLATDPTGMAITVSADTASASPTSPLPITVYDIYNTPTAIILTKLASPSGISLAGAIFDLQYLENNGNWSNVSGYTGLTTDADGVISEGGINLGTYRFMETKAPAGYDLAPASQSFTLDNNTSSAAVLVYNELTPPKKPDEPTIKPNTPNNPNTPNTPSISATGDGTGLMTLMVGIVGLVLLIVLLLVLRVILKKKQTKPKDTTTEEKPNDI